MSEETKQKPNNMSETQTTPKKTEIPQEIVDLLTLQVEKNDRTFHFEPAAFRASALKGRAMAYYPMVNDEGFTLDDYAAFFTPKGGDIAQGREACKNTLLAFARKQCQMWTERSSPDDGNGEREFRRNLFVEECERVQAMRITLDYLDEQEAELAKKQNKLIEKLQQLSDAGLGEEDPEYLACLKEAVPLMNASHKIQAERARIKEARRRNRDQDDE